MSQTVSRIGGQVQSLMNLKNLAVAVAGTGSTTIMELITLGLTRIFVHIGVSVHNLDAFAILGQGHPDASFDTLYSTSGQFTTPTGILVGCSGDLTAQAVGSGWFILDVTGLNAVKVTCSGTSDGTLVDVYASGS